MNDAERRNQSVALTRSQIKSLLAVALEDPDTSLRESGTLGLRAAGAQLVLDEMGVRLGERCESVLADAATTASLNDLRAAKELAKRLAAHAEDRTQQDAAAFLYHLAVAAALCRHGEHISSERLEHQKDVYRRLARLFHGDPTGDVFEKASQ